MTRRALRTAVAGVALIVGAAFNYGLVACSGIGLETTVTTVSPAPTAAADRAGTGAPQPPSVATSSTLAPDPPGATVPPSIHADPPSLATSQTPNEATQETPPVDQQDTPPADPQDTPPSEATPPQGPPPTSDGDLESYRAAIEAWIEAHRPALEGAYDIVAATSETKLTQEYARAAERLKASVRQMAADLEALHPPEGLAFEHAGLVAAAERMSAAAHDLAQGLRQSQDLLIVAAVATMKAAWEDAQPALAALENTLGVSFFP